MADGEVKIEIKANGAESAQRAVGGIGTAFKSLMAPILAVRNAAASMFKTLGTVSFIIHGMSMVVGSVKKLHDWLERTRKAAEEMANARMMGGFAKELDRAAERAERLKAATAETLENLKEMQRREIAERAADYKRKGAEIDLGEQRALVGVTDEEKIKSISEDFKLKRADLEYSIKAREGYETRKAINDQIGAAMAALGKEERYREGREPARERMFRAWRNPGKDVSQDEIKKRETMLDQIDKEIGASDARTKELNKLVDSLKHQRSLIDAEVQAAEMKRSATYSEVANARDVRKAKKEEEERKKKAEDVEKSRKEAEAAEKKAAEAEEKRMRKRLQGQINMARKELQERNAAASAAASRLADARSETQAAQKNFGETLTGSGRRDLRKEERRAAKEERRFQSRLAKLREKYGDDLAPTAFSDDGLTISEKATRRLAFARANEKAAGKERERAAKAAEECEKHLAKLTENIDSGD